MDMRAVVGLNVQRIRRERKFSQEELSFRSGFTRAYLSGLEAGRRNPTIVSLAKLATALGTEIEELIRKPAAASVDEKLRATRKASAARVKAAAKQTRTPRRHRP